MFPARNANTLPFFRFPSRHAATARQIRPTQSAREYSSSRFPAPRSTHAPPARIPCQTDLPPDPPLLPSFPTIPRQACVRSNSVKPAPASTVAPSAVARAPFRAVDALFPLFLSLFFLL